MGLFQQTTNALQVQELNATNRADRPSYGRPRGIVVCQPLHLVEALIEGCDISEIPPRHPGIPGTFVDKINTSSETCRRYYYHCVAWIVLPFIFP
jgi:hypothetical protein